MKYGDLVKITSRTDGDVDGELATLLEFVDENLNSGRMCYAKVMLLSSGEMRYLCPDSLEVLQ
jgi:hypothetical protein